MSNIFGVRRRTQWVTMWECWVITSNTNFDFFFFFFRYESWLVSLCGCKNDGQGDLLCPASCYVGNIDNGKESKQNLVWRTNSNNRFSVILGRCVSLNLLDATRFLVKTCFSFGCVGQKHIYIWKTHKIYLFSSASFPYCAFRYCRFAAYSSESHKLWLLVCPPSLKEISNQCMVEIPKLISFCFTASLKFLAQVETFSARGNASSSLLLLPLC